MREDHLELIKAYLDWIKNNGKYPSLADMHSIGFSRAYIRERFVTISKLRSQALIWAEKNDKEIINLLQSIGNTNPVEHKSPQRKLEIVKAYVEFVKKNNRHPSRSDLVNNVTSNHSINAFFGPMKKLCEAAKEWAANNDPQAFSSVIDLNVFSDENYNSLQERISSYKKFVITTAVVNCTVHPGFLESIKTYCEKNNALLLVLPSADPASAGEWCLDPTLGAESIVVGDVAINSNLFICSIKLNAKQIDPSTGLGRIGQRTGSFIYASPKQRLKFMPVSNVKFPHAEMTTGAITNPRYFNIDRGDHSRYYSERTAYIANYDHVIGAVIVEVQDEEKYHFRQIQANEDGHFVDLGDFYQGGKVTRMNAEAISMGDWHSGETDPVAVESLKELISVVKPSKLFVHDGFNGLSINYHESNKLNRRHSLATSGMLSLKDELKKFADDLDMLSSLKPVKEIIVVKSNHDLFLHKWLEYGNFIKDVINYGIGLDLAKAMKDGYDPLKYAVEMLGLKSKKIRWLKLDEDYFIAKIQCGAHGHAGPKGARGSIVGMEKSYGQSVTGHAHTPEILRGAWQNGTMSYLKLGYNEGPSDWVHANTVIYPNGMRQLINSFDGEWRVK